VTPIFFEPRLELVGGDARGAEAREVALGIGEEYRHADIRELLGDPLQGHRLAGAGGAGDQAMAVGELRQQDKFDLATLGDGQGVGHGWDSPGC
jgi:hypothetical protein